jgi:hypothetical protein
MVWDRELLRWSALTESTTVAEVTFETYGVRVRVVADAPETLVQIPRLLPPGWQETASGAPDTTFKLTPGPGDTVELTQDERLVLDGWRLEVALEVLGRELREFVAVNARGLVFVHAGVVVHRGYAIVLPGKTWSGKTSLVAAFVRAGAVYYSDEYAPLDDKGLVHPYPKPLSLRKGGGQIDHDVESLGGIAGSEPAPVGMFAITVYRPGARWDPARLSAGEAVLALLEDTLPAQTRPADCMRALSAAAANALVVKSERGEAADLVPHLLAALDDALATRGSVGRKP